MLFSILFYCNLIKLGFKEPFCCKRSYQLCPTKFFRNNCHKNLPFLSSKHKHLNGSEPLFEGCFTLKIPAPKSAQCSYCFSKTLKNVFKTLKEHYRLISLNFQMDCFLKGLNPENNFNETLHLSLFEIF